MSKKDTEIQVIDSADGVELKVGTHTIRKIRELPEGKFEVLTADDKHLTTAMTYADAEEEAIRSYNLAL
ncbi:MAG: DUF2969 domain-containing protein [Streptococcaceae bacterium]|jgi:hypothetical protein|nr:DUF2969 domain-containing protein [Streptococcaceae bacterium]